MTNHKKQVNRTLTVADLTKKKNVARSVSTTGIGAPMVMSSNHLIKEFSIFIPKKRFFFGKIEVCKSVYLKRLKAQGVDVD